VLDATNILALFNAGAAGKCLTPTNMPPTVLAGADKTIYLPTNSVVLNGSVFDDGLPAGSPLTLAWNYLTGPSTVFFNTMTQPVVTVTFTNTGVYTFQLSATDGELTASDTVTVTVLPDPRVAPAVALISPTNGAAFEVPIGGTTNVTLTATVSDVDGHVTSVEFFVNGGSVNLRTNAPYTFVLSNLPPATYSVTAVATDNSGLSATSAPVGFAVYIDVGGPVVSLLTPLDAATVTAPTIVTGSVSSAILQTWALQYRLKPADDIVATQAAFNWITLSTGNTAMASGPVGTLDPTLLLNGIYELQLAARDFRGRIGIVESTVVIDRNMKIGNFTLSFTDLTIPVAGIPIQVIRTYDSRDKRVGDFGVGWTLDLKNVRLQKNRFLGQGWEETTTGGLFPSYQLDPIRSRIVTITFPDNKVYKFNFTPNPMFQPLLPIRNPQWSFTPFPGTHGTLQPAGIDEQDGEFLIVEGSIPGPINLHDLNYFSENAAATEEQLNRYPTLFRFTSQEGFKYLIDERDGLRSATDPNGNTLLVTTNGLTWTNAAGGSSLSVVFQRDTLGRITNILDATGYAMSYRYDTNGNLVTFTDREGSTNGFTYDGRHGLLGIADARGIEAVRNEYDDTGRLIRHVNANGKQIEYAHDINNRLEIITNRLGFVTISEYDERGNVVKVTDADGAVTSSAYDGNDNLVMTVDPLGRTNRFTYDARDNRTSTTDALGNITRMTYNDMRRVTSKTDTRGNTITNVYDTKGNLLAMRDPLGNMTRFVYNTQGQPLAMTNALGFVTQFDYDDKGRLRKEIDPLGHETTFQRDTNGNLLTQSTTRTTSSGVETLSVFFHYDSQSRLTNSILPDGSSVRTIYNSIGKAAATIDQLGHTMLLDYDEFGRMVRSVAPDGSSESSVYDAEGRRIASTNRLGQVTFFEYDAVGRLFRSIYPDGTSTTNHFDRAGQVIASTDARGVSSFNGYDAAGRTVAMTNALGQVSRSIYDAAGNLVQTVDALGRTNTFFYDALNRRTNTAFADGTMQSTAYDALGRRLSETDQAGITTFFGYDPLGRLTSVTNAHGDVARYEYNELGQQIRQIDANNHTTSFEYDSLGRRVKRTLPGGQVETYGYSINGLMTNRTDFNGDSTAFYYDVMNRLVRKVPDARRFEPTVSFGYNELGLRTNMVDASGVTTYRYDNRNRLIEKATPQGTLYYVYDANGSVTNIRSSNLNGVALSYSYDELNRLNEVVDPHTGRTSYTYDDVGNLRGYTLPNSVNTFYSYNALNRLTNMNVSAGLSGLANFAYIVGAAGNRLTATETIVRDSINNVATTINRAYGYDRSYRLTNETIGGTSYATPATLDYSYDKVGNRLSLASTLANIQGVISSFDLNDRLTTDTYDANGNTTIGRIVPNTPPVVDRYDFENRLVNRNDGAAQIVYDGDGNRVRKTVNGLTTLYLVDTINPTGYAQVLEELTSSNAQPAAVTRVYTYGHVLLSQDQIVSSGWLASYYGHDGHGNIRFLTDQNGFVTDTYDYDAFGNLIARAGITPNNYLFTGEQFDSDLGLYYLRARYANPGTGRFWSMDEFEGFGSDPSSLHKYTYCNGNPVNCIDPSGHFTLSQINFAMATRVVLYGIAVAAIINYAVPTLIGKYNTSPNVLADPNEKYRAVIMSAARDNRLDPAFLAAIVATELDDLNFKDYTFDAPGFFFGTSLGWAQITDANVVRLHPTWGPWKRFSQAVTPETSIRLAAELIRKTADEGAANMTITPFKCNAHWLNPRDFSKDGREWTEAMMCAAAYNYTQTEWLIEVDRLGERDMIFHPRAGGYGVGAIRHYNEYKGKFE
jgi:RHS repeat-associated protein